MSTHIFHYSCPIPLPLCQQPLVDLTANLNDLYAFHYKSAEIVDHSQGWDDFDLRSEYLRMGVDGRKWTLSSLNKNYEVNLP